MKLKNIALRKSFLTKKKHFIFWVALTGILILSYFAKDLYQYFSPSENQSGPLQVQTVRVKEASMPELIETIGTLTAEKELKMKAAGPGRVKQLLVESGSWVKEGTLLANIIAAPELRAPFDGYLTDWLVKLGEQVKEGTELVDLVDTETLSLTYKVPESYASQLDLGQAVQVSVKAFPDKIFEGTVRFISPVVDRKTYTILIRATVKNAGGDLWPGMSARVKQILATHPKALVIPEASLILTMEGYEVFVVAEGKIQKRKIEIAEKSNGKVRIISGLNLGEPVVLTRTFNVREGVPAAANDWTGDW